MLLHFLTQFFSGLFTANVVADDSPRRVGATWVFADGTRLPVIAGGDGPVDQPTIAARLERLAELDADELTQLEADIRAEYDATRAAGPAEDETGADFFATLTALRDSRNLVVDRITAVAAETAEAERLLADLDAEMADVSADDLATLAALSDEDRAALAALDEAGREALASLATPDPELVALSELSDEDRAAVAEWAEAVASPDATVTPITPPAVEETAEETAARAAAALSRLPARARQPQPAPTPARQAAVARSWHDDTPMTTEQVGSELLRAASSYGNTPGREVRVASIALGDDVPRPLEGESFQDFFDRQLGELRAHRGGAAVRQASGPVCAPAYVDYGLLALGTEDQPIGSLFPRGGGVGADAMKNLSFFQALTLDTYSWGGAVDGASDSTSGVGSATATQNNTTSGQAGSPYPKTALRATCPTPVTCEQRAVWLEIVFDNLNSMSWPEFVQAVQTLGRFALAKEKEELRLEDWYDAADAANLVLAPQTTGQAYGANHSVLSTILSLVTHDRADKNDANAPYVAAIPFWLEPALAQETLAMLDVSVGSISVEDARREILRRYGVTVTSYLYGFGKSDEARTTANDFDTFLPGLADAAVVPQLGPCEARIGVARDDAAFVRMGEELNLGMLRTETDLENNDHRFFEEGWDRLCFRIPPIVADVRVNPSGATAAGVTPADVCSGSGS